MFVYPIISNHQNPRATLLRMLSYIVGRIWKERGRQFFFENNSIQPASLLQMV
jgi:hypothetical protein